MTQTPKSLLLHSKWPQLELLLSSSLPSSWKGNWVEGREHDFKLRWERIKQHKSIFNAWVLLKGRPYSLFTQGLWIQTQHPWFLQWLCANKVIWKSFFLLAPVKCLPSLKHFQWFSWPSAHEQRWHKVTPYPPLTLLCQVTFLLLLILCQTGCRKKITLSAWPDI